MVLVVDCDDHGHDPQEYWGFHDTIYNGFEIGGQGVPAKVLRLVQVCSRR